MAARRVPVGESKNLHPTLERDQKVSVCSASFTFYYEIWLLCVVFQQIL
jgi:hypothetical protein